MQLRLQVGLRNVQATALMRDYRAQDMSFEIVDIGMEERTKFRKLLVENMVKKGNLPEGQEPGNRGRGSGANLDTVNASR